MAPSTLGEIKCSTPMGDVEVLTECVSVFLSLRNQDKYWTILWKGIDALNILTLNWCFVLGLVDPQRNNFRDLSSHPRTSMIMPVKSPAHFGGRNFDILLSHWHCLECVIFRYIQCYCPLCAVGELCITSREAKQQHWRFHIRQLTCINTALLLIISTFTW